MEPSRARLKREGAGRRGGWQGAAAGRWAMSLAGLLLVCATTVQAQSYQDAELRQVLREVESTTDYRFLFRDALVAGRKITVELGSDPVRGVAGAMESMGLGVRVDHDRGQVLVYALPKTGQVDETVRRVTGHVLDGESGARLPFSTVSWIDETGSLRGVIANESGYFAVTLPAGTPEQLTVAYVGFDPTTVSVPSAIGTVELAVRLEPRPVLAREVVVAGAMLHSDLDTTWQSLIAPGIISPLGESSVLRALTVLPSVSVSPAMSDGLVVRGSKADGFQVLLDGLPIYSRTHLFGLFDAFNEDALQTVSFYYGVAPSSFQAPPGGTLSFLTRTGSQERVAGSVGGSSTSLRGTLEGPLGAGRGSWLLSGRMSYLDRVNWFGNDVLIAQGLDTGRETSLDARAGPPFQVLNGEASYHDLHAKVFLEAASGARLTLTGYTGGDLANQLAERRIRVPGAAAGQRSTSSSSWGASSVGGQFQRTLGPAFLAVSGGVTRYDGSYGNDAVVGIKRDTARPPADQIAVAVSSFENDNQLTQARLAPELSFGGKGVWSVGADLNLYEVTYAEVSQADRRYALNEAATQLDLHAGYTSPRFGPVRYLLGLRSHYYSSGDYFRLSPRAELRLGADGPISGALGFSQNHQFLHQLEVQPAQESAPSVWILSSDTESPGAVNYFTAGLYVRPSPHTFLQVEGYHKEFRNLRLHETANPDPRGASLAGELTNPWLTDVDGRSSGVETMIRHQTGPVVWSHGYARSRTAYANPRVLDGREFLVAWDRTHQYTASAEWRLGSIGANLSWFSATGTPNSLRFTNNREALRLPSYHRLDLGVEWERRVGSRTVSAGLSVYNVLDRSNVWYRTLVPTEVGGTPANPIVQASTAVDVYDLGRHPSFELTIRF